MRLIGNRVVAALAPDVVRSWLLPGPQPQRPVTRRVANGAGGLFLSPDGAASVEPLAGPPFDSFTGALVRNTTTGRLLGTVAVPPVLTAIAASADGRKLLLLAAQSQEVADVADTGKVHLRGLPGPPAGALAGCHWFAGAFSGDGRLAAGADQCGGITIWDARSGARLRRLTTSGAIAQIAFSPDGRHLAVASSDSTITVWVVQTGRTVHVLHGHTLEVDGVAYSPNGALLASASLDDTLRVWDAVSGRLLRTWREPRPVTSVAFSSDGRQLVTGDTVGTIRIWDACTACDNARALLAIGKRSVTRQLTPLERATFLAGY